MKWRDMIKQTLKNCVYQIVLLLVFWQYTYLAAASDWRLKTGTGRDQGGVGGSSCWFLLQILAWIYISKVMN